VFTYVGRQVTLAMSPYSSETEFHEEPHTHTFTLLPSRLIEGDLTTAVSAAEGLISYSGTRMYT